MLLPIARRTVSSCQTRSLSSVQAYSWCSSAAGAQVHPAALWLRPCRLTEEQAVKELSGPIDVYVSKFKPMKYTISGRDERTLMKLIVHHDSDRVVGCHM